MSNLAFVSILFGAIIILIRGPIIFAPEASRKFFLKLLFSSNTRIRLMGIFAVALGLIMIYAAQGDDHTAALIIKYFGWFLVIVAVFIFVNIMENMDALILRIIGIFSVGIGALFIYLGLFVL